MKHYPLYESSLKELKDLIGRAEYLKYTLGSLIYWDKITYMPPKGIDYRTKVMSFLADEQYRLVGDRRFRELVDYFDGHPENDRITDAMIRRIRRNSKFSASVPEDEYGRYIELIAISEQVWEKAREENDFELFRPYLEEIFSTFRRFAAYWGDGDPYDALMGYYEEDLTVKRTDQLVSEIKPFLTEAVDSVSPEKNSSRERLSVPPADRYKQEKLWTNILGKIGFDFEAGRVDTGAHPTILANSPDDVRIVNSYREDDFRFGLFNVLHSGGKGIYQQSISRELLGTFLAEPSSFAMEEAIGRFYENIIGRSRGFIEYFYNDTCRGIGTGKYSPEEIFEDANVARPSAIRMEADEFTYLLHVIIRYEIEKDVIEGGLKVKDIPGVWNEKYREYLGVTPADDGEGVLQDIHWAGGYVGYFPSYIIANLAAAQFKASMEKETGDLDGLLGKGRFDIVKRWFGDNIFKWGSVYSTRELIEKATGEPLKAEYYIDYLRNKFSEVYKSDHTQKIKEEKR